MPLPTLRNPLDPNHPPRIFYHPHDTYRLFSAFPLRFRTEGVDARDEPVKVFGVGRFG